MSRQIKWINAALARALGAGGLAVAQSYRAATVRMLVPFPPGGGTDYVARLLGRDLSENWGHSEETR